MIRYTSVVLSISILLLLIDLIHLSSEYEKHSTESVLHDDYSLDRTIDVTDQEVSNQESTSKSSEEENIGQVPRIGKNNALENDEPSLEGNLYFTLSIAILFLKQ